MSFWTRFFIIPLIFFSIHTPCNFGYTQIYLKSYDDTKIALLYKFS